MLFAREFSRADDTARVQIVQAVAIASTWPTWVSLRDVVGLSVPDSTEVMKRMISALVESVISQSAQPLGV